MFGNYFSGLLDDFNADPVTKEWKGYMGQGMDYLSNMLPDRETMKGYIDGPYDDYVIDKVADGYGYLRGLLDEAPDPYAGYDPTAEYMELNQPAPQAYDPTAEAMAVQAMPDSSIKQLFQRKRPRIMEALESANRRAPRPMVWGAAAGSVPEEFAKLSDTPVGTPESMYRQMQLNPEGLLGGTMQPERFQEEELIPQPVVPGVNPRMLLKKMKQLQGYGG